MQDSVNDSFTSSPFVKGGWGDFRLALYLTKKQNYFHIRMLKYNKNLKQISRVLRKNMTKEEVILWSKIRGKQIKETQFYRQKAIGNYVADFYCPKAKLIVELDGSQHYEEEGMKKDRIRDEYFETLGLKVLRFTNLDILKNLNGVLERIYENIPD